MSDQNRTLVEVVDGWALAEESDLPLDRIYRLLDAARQQGRDERIEALEVTDKMVERGAEGIESVVALGIDNIDRDVVRACLSEALTIPEKEG